MKEPVACEVECVDLDLRLLCRMDESDVAVGEHGLDLEQALARNYHGERLSRRHHASHCMNGELLHDAVDRRGQMLKFRALVCLDHLLRSACSLLLGLCERVIGR